MAFADRCSSYSPVLPENPMKLFNDGGVTHTNGVVATMAHPPDCRWCLDPMPADPGCKGLCTDCHERQLRMLRSRAEECKPLHPSPLTREQVVEVKRRLGTLAAAVLFPSDTNRNVV